MFYGIDGMSDVVIAECGCQKMAVSIQSICSPNLLETNSDKL